MTVTELLIALALGASLSAAMMQLVVGSMHIQSVQSAIQDMQQRSAYAQFLLRSAIRGTASPCAASTGGGTGGGAVQQPVVLAAHHAAVSAVPGSHVLRLSSADCDVPVHFYYLGRRGNDQNNLTGLFRRRQRSDGSFYAAEELIEGVTGMTASVGISVPTVTPGSMSGVNVSYVSVAQVVDWSRVFSVNLTLTLQHVTAVPTRHSSSGEMAVGAVTMMFNTALRQAEMHRANGRHRGA